MFHTPDSEEPTFSDTLELDLGDVEPSIAGPKRPQDRIALTDSQEPPSSRCWGACNDGAPPGRSNGHDEPIKETFPASDPPGDDAATRPTEHADARAARPTVERAARRAKTSDCIEVTDADGRQVRPRSRARRDRRDHELHEHLEPLGDDRRRPAGEEGGRARARRQALGEDVARARLHRRHRLPRELRPRRVPERAQVRPRRVRLHDLHRQLRPALRRDLGGGQREGPRRLRGALRQPQLRGPDQPGREGELPRLAAALRRLRARRADGLRLRVRAARPGHRRRGRLPARHLAELRGDQRHGRRRRPRRDVREELRERLRGRRALEGDPGARGGPLHLARLDLRPPAAVLRGHGLRAGRPTRADRERPGAGQARRLDHHRPHLARPGRSRRPARPGSG